MNFSKIAALVAALFFASTSSAFAGVISGTTTVLEGGTQKTILTSSSATACTSLEVTKSGQLNTVIDASGVGQTVTLSLYDEGTSPSCASADLIYTVVILTGQVITLNIPLASGLAYKLSAAATNNIIIDRI